MRRWLGWVCFVLMASGVAGQPADLASCELPSPVQSLRHILHSSVETGRVPDDAAMRALATALRDIQSLDQIAPDRSPPGLPYLRDAATSLRDEGTAQALRRSARQLEKFEAALVPYCSRGSKYADGAARDSPGFYPAWLEAIVSRIVSEPPPRDVVKQTVSLLGLALAAIALLLLFFRGQAVYRAYRLNRKSCLIPARLMIHDRALMGHVTILGLKGFRFVAEDPDATPTVLFLAKMGEASLYAGGLICPCALHFVDEDGVIGFFEVGLSLAHHSALLKASTRTPAFVPSRRIPPRNIPVVASEHAPRRAFDDPNHRPP
ncbi:hypothetical protein [Pacificoceanicola onchidii]|uniref:hypothetical protein n=1 Tax=Pacificoceanicola onchidii TaxID=2562685 RepID=UPI0014561670|nr:hypothetical protein [Pacificoceanicola onchidii]